MPSAGTLLRRQHPAPSLSPERQHLAEAIEARRAEDARRVAITAAYEASASRVFETRRAVEAAEEAINKARVDAAEFLIAEGLGEAVKPPLTPREARLNLAAAEDERDAAISARDELAKKLEQAEGRGSFPEMVVRDAALAVIRAEAGDYARRLAAKIEKLQRELLLSITAADWLHGTATAFPVVTEPGPRYGRPLDDGIATTIVRMNGPPAIWFGQPMPPEMRGDGAWKAALEALIQDAAAPLPLGG